MSEDSSHHEKRITTLEGDVSALKIDVSKIGYQLDCHAEKSEERHGVLSSQQVKLIDLLESRDQDAREYRARREELEKASALARQQWLASLLNPQTIIIILGILAALLGTRVADVQAISEMVGVPLSTPPVPE